MSAFSTDRVMIDPIADSLVILSSRDVGGLKAVDSARISSIDVARGAAMFFVCLSHFSGAYLWPHGVRSGELLVTVSMIASPSFVLISGMVFGLLGALKPGSVPHLRIRLVDRGVFLLLVGHLLLAVAQLRRNSMAAAYGSSFLTDALAIAIIVGPPIVRLTRPLGRSLIAVSIYVGAWLMLVRFHPSTSAALVIQQYILGWLPSATHAPRALVFPVLPWVAVYLWGTVLGECIGSRYRRNEERLARRMFLNVGLACTFVGIVVFTSTRLIATVHSFVSRSTITVLLTSPTLKFPPGPVYILFFGGSGLLFMWMVLELESRQRLRRLVEGLRRVGYSSLPVFLLQVFVYSALLRPANFIYSAWWPLLFVITLIPIWVLATLWSRMELNWLLTVGITGWLEGRTKAPTCLSARCSRTSASLRAVSYVAPHIRQRA